MNIEIDLINRCNLKCPECDRQQAYSKTTISNNKIDLTELCSFIDYFDNNSITEVDLIGKVSEPTLYPDLFPLLEYLNSRNIKVVISTNASTHTPKWWAELATYIKNDSEVWFCIDGSTQEIHSWYRRGSKLQKVLDNHAAFKQGNPKAISICHRIDFVKTQHDKDNVIALAKENGFNYLLDIQAAHAYMPEFKGFVEEAAIADYKSCPYIKYGSIFIEHTGKIYPCCNTHIRITDKTIGNITKAEIMPVVKKDILLAKRIFLDRHCRYHCPFRSINEFPTRIKLNEYN